MSFEDQAKKVFEEDLKKKVYPHNTKWEDLSPLMQDDYILFAANGGKRVPFVPQKRCGKWCFTCDQKKEKTQCKLAL